MKYMVVYGRGNNESVYTHDIGLQWIHNESVYTKPVYNGHVSKSVLWSKKIFFRYEVNYY